MFQAKVVEKIKTQILYSVTFSENRAVYEIMRENMIERDKTTSENIIRLMCFACRITKATDTLRICNTYCFSTATMVELTRFIVTLYVHCPACAYCIE